MKLHDPSPLQVNEHDKLAWPCVGQCRSTWNPIGATHCWKCGSSRPDPYMVPTTKEEWSKVYDQMAISMSRKDA